MVTQEKSILEGIRVIECAVLQAGPEAGKLLAELGADVIKIEERLIGDPSRQNIKSHGTKGALPGGLTVSHETHNRSKRSITVDLKKSEGREIAYRLVEKSDVFVTNVRRKAIMKLGMGYDVLRRYNPRLIYLMLSGLGTKGPESDLPALGIAIVARSGIMMLEKAPDEFPSPAGKHAIADKIAAALGVAGVLGALYARERSGLGQEVNVALLGSLAWLFENPVSYQWLTGQTYQYQDRRKVPNPFHNTYQAGDGKWFFIGMPRSDPGWPAFCRAIGIEQYEKDPKFENQQKREVNSQELIAILDRVFAQRTQAEWLQRFREGDLVAQGVNTLEDLSTDPQMIENGFVENYNHPVLGSVNVLGCPVEFSQTPHRMVSVAPALGQHTEDVLLSLGYSWEDIAQLQDKEVI